MVVDRGGARNRAGRQLRLGMILAALVLELIGTSAWAQPGTPDIRGEYQGSGEISLSACTNHLLDVPNIGFTPSINVSQTDQNFTADASGPVNIPVNAVTFEAQLTGTVTTGGSIPTSPFTFTLFQGGNPMAGGSGTFTGQAGSNQITFNITGNVTSGETCKLTGSMAGTRPTTTVAAAVLPASRSVQVNNPNNPATAFATIINASSTAGLSCQIAPSTSLPAVFSFQATDPQTNQTISAQNAPMDIPGNQLQTFVVAFMPSAAIPPTDVQLAFACANSGNAPVISGVNTLLLSASDTPVADVVALAATIQNDGIVHIPPAPAGLSGTGAFGTGIFAVATVNLGAGASITASADTGGTVLPLSVQLCQTDSGGLCLATMGPSVTTQINAGQTPTFGVFVQGNGPIAFDPADNRVFVRFKDAGGVTRGATSVAVQTQ